MKISRNVIENAQREYWNDVYKAAKIYNAKEKSAKALAKKYNVTSADLLRAANKLSKKDTL